jgi:type I restriction enzyme M protein
LILRRKSEQEKLAESLSGAVGEYQIFMAIANSVGKDRRGKTVYVRDPEGREVVRPDLYGVYRDSTLLDYHPTVEPSGRIVSDDLPAIAARFTERSTDNGARGRK